MRWVVVFLLVANIAFYFWLQQVTDASVSEYELTENTSFNVDFEAIKPLQLVSERKVKVPEPRQPESDAYELRFEQGQVEAESAAEVVDAAIDPMVVEGAEALDADGVQAAAESAKKPEPVVPVEADARAVDEPAEPEVCAWIGPFEDQVSAKQVVFRLQSLDIMVESRERKVEIEPLYWVYIPSLGSRKAALALLRDLQSRRIDSFVVTEGDYKHAISLGYFSKRQSVENAKAPHLGRPYDVEVERRPRFNSEYWLRAEAEQATLIGEELLRRVAEDYPNIKKVEKNCEIVAL